MALEGGLWEMSNATPSTLQRRNDFSNSLRSSLSGRVYTRIQAHGTKAISPTSEPTESSSFLYVNQKYPKVNLQGSQDQKRNQPKNYSPFALCPQSAPFTGRTLTAFLQVGHLLGC